MSKVRHLYLYKSYTLFIISDNQLFELYKVRAALFMAKAFLLLKLIMTRTGWGAVSTICKVFGMTRTRTQVLPIQIWVCYYWAKSARFGLRITHFDFVCCCCRHCCNYQQKCHISYHNYHQLTYQEYCNCSQDYLCLYQHLLPW